MRSDHRHSSGALAAAPFVATYDADPAALPLRTAPAYDLVPPEERERPAEADPRSVVHLTLPPVRGRRYPCEVGRPRATPADLAEPAATPQTRFLLRRDENLCEVLGRSVGR